MTTNPLKDRIRVQRNVASAFIHRTCAGTDGAEIQYSWTSIDILPDNIWMSDE